MILCDPVPPIKWSSNDHSTKTLHDFFLIIIMTRESKISLDAAGKEWLSCRDVLWLFAITGFALHILLEANVSLTIVVMVVPRPEAASVSQCKYDVELTSNVSHMPGDNVSSFSSTDYVQEDYSSISSSMLQSVPKNITTSSANSVKYADRLSWNEYEQGLALGGNVWLQWFTQLPGGFLARRHGTKFIFGGSLFVSSLLGLLLPIGARFHLYAFVAIRVLQGSFGGFIYPAMQNLIAKWIPSHERNKFMSAYFGNSVGMAISNVMYAMLINWFGWESVFYVTSVIGVAWSIAWFYLVYDTPQEHPRISVKERTYILENMGNTVDHVNSQPVPWKAILTSGPLWITSIVTVGGIWGFFFLGMEAPSYFNYIHGWSIGATSVCLSASNVGRMIFSYGFSKYADRLLRMKKISATNLRKISMFICNGSQVFAMLGLAFSGCHPTLAMVFIIIGMTISGSLSAGTLASCIDLSPNYASILFGVSNTVTWGCVTVIPMIVGILTNIDQTIEQWRLVFLIMAAVPLSTGVIYMFIGTSDLQDWNDLKIKESDEELRELQSNGEEDAEHVDAVGLITVEKIPTTFTTSNS